MQPVCDGMHACMMACIADAWCMAAKLNRVCIQIDCTDCIQVLQKGPFSAWAAGHKRNGTPCATWAR
jgi:hypothetical protein